MSTIELMSGETLNSWKEIAQYLDRGVRTVQRWERDLQLPVRRNGRGKSSIQAVRKEIDAWLDSCPILPQGASTPDVLQLETTFDGSFAGPFSCDGALVEQYCFPAEASNDGPEAGVVLLVDDNPAILEVRRLLFGALGYVAVIAESGRQALEIMRGGMFDAVILDYRMPGMDGEETARRIRELDAEVPIILSTGTWELPRTVFTCITELVEKGAGAGPLVDALERQLQRSRSRHGQVAAA